MRDAGGGASRGARQGRTHLREVLGLVLEPRLVRVILSVVDDERSMATRQLRLNGHKVVVVPLRVVMVENELGPVLLQLLQVLGEGLLLGHEILLLLLRTVLGGILLLLVALILDLRRSATRQGSWLARQMRCAAGGTVRGGAP